MDEFIQRLLIVLIILAGGISIGLLIVMILKMIINKQKSQSKPSGNNEVKE